MPADGAKPTEIVKRNAVGRQSTRKDRGDSSAATQGAIRYHTFKCPVYPPTDWPQIGPALTEKSGQKPASKLALDFVYGYGACMPWPLQIVAFRADAERPLDMQCNRDLVSVICYNSWNNALHDS